MPVDELVSLYECVNQHYMKMLFFKILNTAAFLQYKVLNSCHIKYNKL